MRIWISAVLPGVGSAFTAGLLALGASGCVTQAPPLAPAPSTTAALAPGAAPRPLGQRPDVVPSPASVPGRLKIALVAGWLWMDGHYVGRLERLDYVKLFARIRERRAAGGDAAEANTLELELDAATDWRDPRYLLGICEDYERVELITTAGRFSLRLDPRGRSTTPESSNEHRALVFARRDGIALWGDRTLPGAAPVEAEPEPETLLEVRSHDELDAGLQRVCSTRNGCADFSLYFEEGVHGRELVRVIESLAHAPGKGATPAVINLALPLPPLPGDEATAFIPGDPDSGHLPLIVMRQVVRRMYGRVRDCFEAGFANHPKLAGVVNVRFSIARDGAVSEVTNVGGDLPDDVTQCLMQGFRALRFPAPKDGVMSVQYPILLRPH